MGCAEFTSLTAPPKPSTVREPGRFDVRVPRGLLLTESFDLIDAINLRPHAEGGEVAETQKCKENVKASTSF